MLLAVRQIVGETAAVDSAASNQDAETPTLAGQQINAQELGTRRESLKAPLPRKDGRGLPGRYSKHKGIGWYG